MKRLLGLAFAAGLLLMPVAVYAEYGQDAKDAPPVAPTLVREGDFAVKLVAALNLGKEENEAQAEKMLAEDGIAPKNGWISDYPVTPDVLGDVRDTVIKASGSGKIAMNKDEALKGLEYAETSLGLQIDVAKAEPQAKVTTSDYVAPEAVDEYYSDEGPPVVTYYPPPWDYYYLYDWVPSPFWFSDFFFFPGFFVLRTFTVNVVVVNGQSFIVNGTTFIVNGTTFTVSNGVTRVVSNVVIDPVSKSTLVVDPVKKQLVSAGQRTTMASLSKTGMTSNTAATWSGSNRKAAESIFNRSVQHGQTSASLGRGTAGTSGTSTMTRSAGSASGVTRNSTGQGRGGTRNNPAVTGPATGRTRSSDWPVVTRGTGTSRGGGTTARSFDQPAPTVRGESPRSFSAPARSFSQPAPAMRGGGGTTARSFSAPAPAMRGGGFEGGRGGGRSFGGGAVVGGGGGRGGGGGFSGGGHSFGGGGCMGRHC